MDLLLIAPARDEAVEVAGRKISTVMAPPLNLAIVAALTPPEWDVRIVDENLEPVDFDARADLVGITITTRTANQAYEMAREFRRRGKPVVVGGIHPSTLPDEAVQHASAVVVGEAETTWPDLLRDFQNGALKQVYRADHLANIDQIPVPRRELFRPKGYLVRDTISTTRGCPYSCSFCTVTNFFGRSYRFRPVESVVREIDALGAKTIFITDDNIVGSPRYAREFFQALIPRKLKWVGQSSLAIARDEELLRLAATSGCIGLFIGFESVDEVSLRLMGKKANVVDDYEDAVKRIHRHGISVFGAFIFGFDEDDEGVFERTLRFARRARLEGAQFNTLTPYPGTAIYENLEKEGRILSKDWSRYNMCDVVFVPKKMSPETLAAGHLWAWREFYSIPSIMQRVGMHFNNFGAVMGLNLMYRRHWYSKGNQASPQSVRLPSHLPS